jgi:catalase
MESTPKKRGRATAGREARIKVGAPAVQPPTLEEPITPQPPLRPKPDQAAPAPVTATGNVAGRDPITNSQAGDFLTTAQGVRVYDTDRSLKAGDRGPTLLQDHHLREKITHFDHERIPERVVHARGSGAHGFFTANGAGERYSKAAFLRKGAETPVFVRFSTVLGSRGSADTVRDTRGFATKFYTEEGVFDLVGNNMPVFFIQDGIKFPDIIHAAKPHPDREIPQAQSAHDTFWDFVSLHTEAQHHTMWNMSDRGIPLSLRMMEGFGVHTFRLVAADGATTLAKFHWKPALGVHSMVWEEAQLTAGGDPDFHRRDLANAIEAGNYPQWDFCIQVFPDTEDQTFEDVDLLDPTKLVPEELAPVQPIGRLMLTANPTNFFAETEQVAFHPGHLVPGIDVVNDPLLQARLFSYLDTQITRLGGPNFAQIPINRPHAPVNDNQRDGFHQDAVHGGAAPYRPNSLDGGNPFVAPPAKAYAEAPVPVKASVKTRKQGKPARAGQSFDDHFSQPRMFWLSMSPVEKDHIIQAYIFELSKCFESVIRERQLRCLAMIHHELAAAVAEGLGMAVPRPDGDISSEVSPSPALSQVGKEFPTTGRIIGILVDDSHDLTLIVAVRDAVQEAGMLPLLIAAHGGKLGTLTVDRTLLATRSFEYDALILTGPMPPAPDVTGSSDANGGRSRRAKAAPASGGPVDPRVRLMLGEMFRHCKAIAALPGAAEVLAAAGIPSETPGVLAGDSADVAVRKLEALLRKHRVWERFPAMSEALMRTPVGV